MTAYFDVTNVDHLATIPNQLRGDPDLPAIAGSAERDVINYYKFSMKTQPTFAHWYRLGSGVPNGLFDPAAVPETDAVLIDETNRVYVGLRGYNLDASLADAGLAEALRYAIARVIRWRVAQWRRTPGFLQRGGGGLQETYTQDSEDLLQTGFQRGLEIYDVRPRVWTI